MYSKWSHVIKNTVRCTQINLIWSSTWWGIQKQSHVIKYMVGCTHYNLACMWSSTWRLEVYSKLVLCDQVCQWLTEASGFFWVLQSPDKCVCYAWELHEVFNTNLGSFLAITCWTRRLTKRYTVKPVLRSHLWDKEKVAL